MGMSQEHVLTLSETQNENVLVLICLSETVTDVVWSSPDKRVLVF